MSPLTLPQLHAATRRAAIASLVLAAALGAAGLLASALGAEELRRGLVPGGTPMSPVSAVGILSLAVAGLVTGRHAHRAARFGAAVVATLTVVNLVRVGVLGHEVPVPLFAAFVLSAGALGLAGRRLGGHDLGTACAVGAMAVATFALVGYSSGVTTFFGAAPMSAPSAVAFVCLGWGLLLRQGRATLVRLLASDRAGGMLLRRLLPVAVGLPLVLDVLRFTLTDGGVLPERVGDWLFVFLVLATFGAAAVHLALQVDEAERRRDGAESRVRASEALARSITDTANDAIVCIDATGTITLFNAAAERIFGWAAAEALGQDVSILMPPAAAAAHGGILRRASLSDAPVRGRTIELVGRHRDGRDIDIELSLAAFEREGERGFTAIIRDVTSRKRLEQHVREDAGRLARVVAAQTAIAAAGGQDVVHVVAERACELVGGDGAAIEVPEDDVLVYRAVTGTVAPHLGLRVPLHGSLAGEALRTAMTLHCADSDEDPRVDREACRRIGLRSMICVPLLHGHETLGVLKVVSAEPGAFTERDERTLELLAALVGASLHRSQVQRRLNAHNALSGALAESGTLEGGLRAGLRAIGDALGWDVGVVWLRGRVDDHLTSAETWHGVTVPAAPYVAAVRASRLARGEGVAGRVWDRCSPAWLTELPAEGDDPRLRAAAEVGLRTLACVPIVSNGEVLGAFTVAGLDARPRDRDELELLASLASQVGQFLQRKLAEHDVLAHAQNLAAVVELSHEVTRLRDPAAVRPALCRAIATITGAATVAILEPRRPGRLITTASYGGYVEVGFEVDALGDTATAAAFREGTGRFVADAAGGPPASAALAAETGMRTVYIEPLLRDGAVAGVLVVAWSTLSVEEAAGSRQLLPLLAAESSGALERADLVAALDASARTDQLTGVPNRRAWDEELPREVARARRAGTALSVAILDLDHFKAYNDEFGHPAGDRLLREATAAWISRLRSTDLLARYGGEEFAVLLPGCAEEAAVPVLETLRAAMPPGTSCSIGVAQWDGVEPPAALVARADAALYDAKRAGRDRVLTAGAAR